MTEYVLTDVRDSLFLDCRLSLNNPIDITNVKFSSVVNITTATPHGFSVSDEDNIDIFNIEWEPTIDEFYNATQPDTLNTRRYRIRNRTSTTFDLADLSGVAIDGSTFTDTYIKNGT